MSGGNGRLRVPVRVGGLLGVDEEAGVRVPVELWQPPLQRKRGCRRCRCEYLGVCDQFICVGQWLRTTVKYSNRAPQMPSLAHLEW